MADAIHFSWQCPRCKGPLIPEGKGLVCREDSFCAKRTDGILGLLESQGLDAHRPFIHQYESVRAAERRGSDAPAFYMGLPSRGPGEEWRRRKKGMDWLKQKLDVPMRAGLRGKVLDAGAGCCWLTRHLALWGFDVAALDLTMDRRDGLGAGRHYLTHLPIAFERVQASFDRLPFGDDQFAAVVFNGSFHYAASPLEVLREAVRITQPGASIYILDSPIYQDPRSGQRMLQERGRLGSSFLTPPQLRGLAETLNLRLEIDTPPRRWVGRVLQKWTELRLGRETATLSRVVFYK